MNTTTAIFSTKDELNSAFKAGTISSDDFLAQLETLTKQELAAKEEQIKKAEERLKALESAKLEKTKTLDLFTYVSQRFNENKDVRVLFDLCMLMVDYCKSSTGYTPSIKYIEEMFPGLTFSQVLMGFSAFNQLSTTLFPTKKNSKLKHDLSGKNLSTNEYIVQYLLSLPVEINKTTAVVSDDEF